MPAQFNFPCGWDGCEGELEITVLEYRAPRKATRTSPPEDEEVDLSVTKMCTVCGHAIQEKDMPEVIRQSVIAHHEWIEGLRDAAADAKIDERLGK